MPKGIPITREEIDRRRREIFRSSIALIVKRGFVNTSMQEIADAAGVGKSTLYDYFPTKDHVLIFVFEEELDILQKQAEAIAAQDIPAQEKLSKVLEVQLEFLTSKKNFIRDISLQAVHLGPAGQRRIVKKRHAYQDLLRGIFEQGVREGVFRPINTRLVARAVISIMEALVYTTRPTGTPREMLADALEMVLRGIKP